jgi:hypothetical protein
MPKHNKIHLTTRSSKRNEPFYVSSDPVHNGDQLDSEPGFQQIHARNDRGQPLKPSDHNIQRSLEMLSKRIELMSATLELFEQDSAIESGKPWRRNSSADIRLNQCVTWVQRLFAHIGRRIKQIDFADPFPDL